MPRNVGDKSELAGISVGKQRSNESRRAPSIGLGESATIAVRRGVEAMERTAACHCGSLRAIAAGKPENVDLCHCKACQRRTGSAFHFGATYLKDRVRLEGARHIYERDTDRGNRIRFGPGDRRRWGVGRFS